MRKIAAAMSEEFRSRFGGLYCLAAVMICASFLLRTALLLISTSSADIHFATLAKTYGAGLFFDLVTFFYIAAPGAIFLSLIPDKVLQSRFSRWATFVVWYIIAAAILFDLAAEWLFWDEFSCRFNFIAIDYLIYTQEVVGNIRESYPVAPIFVGIGVVAGLIVFFLRKPLMTTLKPGMPVGARLRRCAAFTAVAVLSLVFVDLSMADVSENRYNDELAKNGLYSFVAAFRNNVLEYPDFYRTEDNQAVFARMRELLKAPNARFVSENPYDLTRQIMANGPEKRYNVILITIESLSADFMAQFGDKANLTPNLNALASDCMFFRNLYATGTRTVRGMEAIVLSIPPTPGSSVVKRPGNENMFSIGFLFRDRGYDNKFIYGGYGYFDNMNYFFEKNGFTTVDRADLKPEEIRFSNAWGVCDEDLLARVLKESDASFAAGKPFFSFVMSTSNHRPFTYPAGKIDLACGHREGGVKYTDYAIGEFLKTARTRPWFDNTIFLIVADHCAGSAGKTAVPVDKYHIPLFVYGPKIVPPRTVDSLASQIDIAPTLLGILNWSYQSRFFGQDVNQVLPDRALLGNYQNIGLMQGGEITVLQTQRRTLNYKAETTFPPVREIDMKQRLFDTIAYYQAASYQLKHGMNRK